jgi:hypothetical protein
MTHQQSLIKPTVRQVKITNEDILANQLHSSLGQTFTNVLSVDTGYNDDATHILAYLFSNPIIYHT